MHHKQEGVETRQVRKGVKKSTSKPKFYAEVERTEHAGAGGLVSIV
jgi:hypothetical protein